MIKSSGSLTFKGCQIIRFGFIFVVIANRLNFVTIVAQLRDRLLEFKLYKKSIQLSPAIRQIKRLGVPTKLLLLASDVLAVFPFSTQLNTLINLMCKPQVFYYKNCVVFFYRKPRYTHYCSVWNILLGRVYQTCKI